VVKNSAPAIAPLCARRKVCQDVFAKEFGAPTQMFNGVDVSGDIRLGRGVRTSGGVSMGRTSLNSCYVVDSQQELLFCDQTPPFQPNIKALIVYPLPWWGVQTSATLQSVPGPSITASRVYSNAEISPSLGRNLASGANGTVTLNVIQPGTVFNHRVSQLDFRLAKDVKTGENIRIRPSIDIFNLFNATYPQTQNTTYGSSWLRPLTILGGRNFRFNVQVDF
jgi:outer membrane receptor protein involved in Fe transport